jgi:hypothetical protein
VCLLEVSCEVFKVSIDGDVIDPKQRQLFRIAPSSVRTL